MVSEDYERATHLLRLLGPRVEDLIARILEVEGIRIHSVTHRVKSELSAQNRVDESNGPISSVSELKDLLGLRVITYFSLDVNRVAAVIEREFAIDPERSSGKREPTDPDRFGYSSLHLVASVSPARADLPEFSHYKDCSFEVQVRSILQHAWAEIEHDLGYKRREAVPREVRHRFARLAGLLELADDEFSGIQEDLTKYEQSLPLEITRDADKVGIDRSSITELVRSSKVLQRIDASIAEVMESSFEDATIGGGSAGRYAAQLTWLELVSIRDVQDNLERFERTIEAFTRLWIETQYETISRGIGLFYLCYMLLAERGDMARAIDFLNEFTIGTSEERDQIGTRLVDVFNEASRG